MFPSKPRSQGDFPAPRAQGTSLSHAIAVPWTWARNPTPSITVICMPWPVWIPHTAHDAWHETGAPLSGRTARPRCTTGSGLGRRRQARPRREGFSLFTQKLSKARCSALKQLRCLRNPQHLLTLCLRMWSKSKNSFIYCKNLPVTEVKALWRKGIREKCGDQFVCLILPYSHNLCCLVQIRV